MSLGIVILGLLISGIILSPNYDEDESTSFERKIMGLGCHQLEQYIILMEASWDGIEYFLQVI